MKRKIFTFLFAIAAVFTLQYSTTYAADVDAYIQYHWVYANSDVSKQETCSCLEKILEVDEGHQGALEKLMVMEFILIIQML